LAACVLVACGGSGGGSGSDPLPEEIQLRPVDGTPSALEAPGKGLAPTTSSCPPGAVIERVQVFLGGPEGPIVGLALGCSALSLVEEDAELRIETGPVENLETVGGDFGSATSRRCSPPGVVTHIRARISDDRRARLLGIDIECAPLFLVGNGTGIETAIGTPRLTPVGNPGGVDTLALSCRDPEVDQHGALATGIEVNASKNELGSLVPSCRRPEIEF